MQAKIQAVQSLLRAQSTLVLATADSAGTPHSTPLFYLAQDDLKLYWFSSRSSRHSRNCALNPTVSAAVYFQTSRWRQIRGLQMRGEVAAVTDRALRTAVAEAYCRRFALGQLFRGKLRSSTLYCFTPAWARYLDNSVRFGYKFQVNLPQRRAPARPSSTSSSPRRNCGTESCLPAKPRAG